MRFNIKKLFSTIWRTIATILLIIFVVVVSAIILLYNSGYIHEQLRVLAMNKLEDYSKRKVYIESLTGNLLTEVTLTRMMIAQEDDLAGRKCIDLESVTVKYNIFDFLNKEIRLKEVIVRKPHIFLGRDRNGQWSLKEVFRPSVDYERGPSKFKMYIDKIVIEDCYYEMDIEKSPIKKFDDINLEVKYKVEEGIHTIDIQKGDLNLIEYEEPVDKFSGRVVVGNGVVLLNTIELENSHSGFITNGLIQYSPYLNYTFSTENAEFDGYAIEEDIFGKEFISGKFNVDADINGGRDWVKIHGDVESDGGALLDYPYSHLEFPVSYQLGLLEIKDFAFSMEIGDIYGDVDLYHEGGEVGYIVKGRVSEMDVSKLQDQLEVESSLNMDFIFSGSGFNAKDLNSELFFLLKPSTYDKAEINSGYGEVLFADEKVDIKQLTTQIGTGVASGKGTIGFDREIDVEIESANIAFSDLLHNYTSHKLGGYVGVKARITGDFKSPDIFGDFVFNKFSFRDVYIDKTSLIIDMRDSLENPYGNANIFGSGAEYGWLYLTDFSTVMKFESGWIEFANIDLYSEDNFSLTSSVDIITDRIGGETVRNIDIGNTSICFKGNELLSFDDADLSLRDNSIDIEPIDMRLLKGRLLSERIIISPDIIEGSITANDLDLNYIEEIGMTDLPVRGIVRTLNISGSGSLNDPFIQCDMSIDDGPIGIMDDFTTELDAEYGDEMLYINGLNLISRESSLNAHAQIPLNLAGLFTDEDIFRSGMEAYCSVNDQDIKFINDFTRHIYIGKGKVSGGVRVGGSLIEPNFNGMFSVSNCDIMVGIMRKELEDVEGDVYVLNNQLIIPEDRPLTANADNGSVSSYGEIDFSNDVRRPEFDLEFDVDNVVLTGISDFTGIISADAELTGVHGEDLLVDADVEVMEGLITTEFFGEGSSFSASRDSMDLDIEVSGRNDIWLRNSSSDIELSVDIIIKRTDGRYNFTGTINALRGYYYFLRKDFKIEEGEIIFEGGNEINPRLDIVGAIPIIDGDEHSVIYIYIQGDLREPEITLYSPAHPGLDQKDILTIVALDMTWEEYQQMSAGEFASSQSREYIENYISDELSRSLRKGIHLDTIRIRSNILSGGGNGEESLTITVGKYLTRKFYISYTRDIYTRAGETLAGEYYIGKNFSFLGKTFEDEGDTIYSFILKYKYKY